MQQRSGAHFWAYSLPLRPLREYSNKSVCRCLHKKREEPCISAVSSLMLTARSPGLLALYLNFLCKVSAYCDSLILCAHDHCAALGLNHLNPASLLDVVTFHKIQNLRRPEHPFNLVHLSWSCLCQCLHNTAS